MPVDSDPVSLSDEQFLEIALEQKLLSKDEASQIGKAAAESDTSLSALCIEKGVLRPVHVDVIRGLAESDNLAPGYEVIDLLGYGGLGIVYRASQPKLDRMIALKTIPIHRIENPSVIARFKQEAKAIGRLKHPNIVAAHDFGTYRDRLYLAMELVEGTDLDELIKKSERLSESIVWALAQQVAAGLAHAAQHNIVHRDIKPGNLLLTKPPAGYPLPRGVPLLKITDFGLVQLEAPDTDGERLTMGGNSLGTPHYMAPEQVADAHVDLKADIYALGATVFHMLVGEPPFVGKTVGQVLTAKLKNNEGWIEKLPSETSRETVELLKVMMAQDPANRPESYGILLERIKYAQKAIENGEVFSNNETIVNISKGDTSLDLLLTSSITIKKENRKLRWLAGLVVVLAAIGAGFYFVGPSRTAVPTIPISDLKASGLSKPLFNGVSTNGWVKQRGSWGAAVDDMGGRILTGANGSFVRNLPTHVELSEEPLEYFGIRMEIGLPSAKVAELHFEHQDINSEGEPGKESPRNVVRMTAEGVALGSKRTKKRDFQANTPYYPLATSSDPKGTNLHYHELRLEYHRDHWLVLLDGQPICSQAHKSEQHIKLIQLYVEGGEAYFANLDIYELTAN